MSKAFDKYQKRRLISSYFSVSLSISLVLFLMGILGILVLNTQRLGDHFKEQININIFLSDAATEVGIKQLEQQLTMAEYTKSSRFISKEEAAKEFSEDIGEDFMDFIGYNPLQDAFELSLKADFVNPAMIQLIADELSSITEVSEVSYDKPLVELLNENVKRISFWILVISSVMSFVAFLLINSSIRLSIYSKRFIIKTMQLVGATKGFIRKPFILQNIKLGIIGAFIASVALLICLYYIQMNLPELHLLEDFKTLAIVISGVFVLGILIAWISTFFAAQRFLNLRTAALYY
ncbi:MAG: ABC transporter permease [Flavobacteriaceae bacterium]|jgi:cell division transport system permease protein|nr:ABC transporter permease [Flavobacteriaceae bacterium]NVJ72002.1 ABC transporter permease [Flavobacteriaceae bacterium]